MGKHAKSVDTQLLGRIISKRQGSVFTPADFLDLGSRTAVGLALMRHARAGTIHPLARGLYDYAPAWIAEIMRKVAAQVLPKSGSSFPDPLKTSIAFARQSPRRG